MYAKNIAGLQRFGFGVSGSKKIEESHPVLPSPTTYHVAS